MVYNITWKKKKIENEILFFSSINYFVLSTWHINQMTFIIITNIDMARIAFVSSILNKEEFHLNILQTDY